MDNYDKPMVPRLTAFKLADGYAPFDPDVAIRMADRLRRQRRREHPVRCRSGARPVRRGLVEVRSVTERASCSNPVGFKRGPNNRWLLPDGTPWKMTINAPNNFEIESQRLAFAVANEWRQLRHRRLGAATRRRRLRRRRGAPAISRPAPTGRPAPSAPISFRVSNTGRSGTSARPERPHPSTASAIATMR